tara:strand:- start:218 stop:391 length:174 start_codon:yes stop_codon:yes gene_type:complete
MNVTSVKYEKNLEGEINSVKATINGVEWFIPINDDSNRHWKAIQEWVANGNTIAEAD